MRRPAPSLDSLPSWSSCYGSVRCALLWSCCPVCVYFRTFCMNSKFSVGSSQIRAGTVWGRSQGAVPGPRDTRGATPALPAVDCLVNVRWAARGLGHDQASSGLIPSYFYVRYSGTGVRTNLNSWHSGPTAYSMLAKVSGRKHPANDLQLRHGGQLPGDNAAQCVFAVPRSKPLNKAWMYRRLIFASQRRSRDQEYHRDTSYPY